MSALKQYLVARLDLPESSIVIIGSEEDQRLNMKPYLRAAREGQVISGVPVGVDGTVVTVNLVGWDHAGDGTWIEEGSFEWPGSFEEPDSELAEVDAVVESMYMDDDEGVEAFEL